MGKSIPGDLLMASIAVGAVVSPHTDEYRGGTLIMALPQRSPRDRAIFMFFSGEYSIRVPLLPGRFVFYLATLVTHHQTSTSNFINLGTYINKAVISCIMQSSLRESPPARCGRCTQPRSGRVGCGRTITYEKKDAGALLSMARGCGRWYCEACLAGLPVVEDYTYATWTCGQCRD